MKTRKHATANPLPLRRTVIAASLLLIAGHPQAQTASERAEALRQDFATPDSRVAAGVGILSGQSRRFGQYNGLDSEGVYGLLNFNLIRRDDPTGTWLKLKGSNLGLDSRELRFDHERQGDWSYFLEGRQLTRHEPLIVRTGLQGIGTSRQTVTSPEANKRDVNLKIAHDTFGFGARKFVAGNVDVRVNFTQDEKRGDRMYGRGTHPVHEFLTEPLDRTTRLWEVVFGYATRQLQLSGGYSGSSFDNHLPRLDVAGGSASFTGGVPPQTRFAMPLSNQAHQLHLAGGINFGESSRSSFKISRSWATQDQPLEAEPGVARFAGSPSSIDGKVVTTLAYADLNLRPADRLDVVASLRHENRDDQSPVRQYIATIAPTVANASGGVLGYRIPRSLKQSKALLEGGYQLGDGYRLVGGVEYEQISRNVPEPYRRIAHREKTDEVQERLELKATVSDTLNGSLAYLHSDRWGSNYVDDTKGQGGANNLVSNQVAALLWADRRRDKLRLTGDWIPDEDWSVQFLAELSEDHYSGRNAGPRDGDTALLSADAAYALSDKWKLSAWASYELGENRQQTRSDPNPANPSVLYPGANAKVWWQADLRTATTAWGIGAKGKLRGLDLGAELGASSNVVKHRMKVLSGNPTDFDSLPDYFYRQVSLKLFADHALDRFSSIRADFTFDHRKNNDWTWQNYVYGPGAAGTPATTTDGTTVRNPDHENVRFLGISYNYRWR